MNKKEFYFLIKTAFKSWQTDNINLRAAALTFFIILPLPSLLLIVLAIFSQFYSSTAAFNQLIEQITLVAGPAIANLFSQLLSGATSPFASVWSSFTTVVFSLAGAIGAFYVLRETMDDIWKVTVPRQKGLINSIKQAIGPFLLISTLGLFVIAWVEFATVLFHLIHLTSIMFVLVEILSTFAASTLLFAVIYKQLPQLKVKWKDVLLSAPLTGLVFTIINYLIGLYVQTFIVTTLIGGAGALIVILLWIFILNQIILFGAELSKVYATTHGSHSKRPHPHN
jgi:membrane protein